MSHSNLNEISKVPSVTFAANLSKNVKTAPKASIAVNTQKIGPRYGVIDAITHFANAAEIDAVT